MTIAVSRITIGVLVLAGLVFLVSQSAPAAADGPTTFENTSTITTPLEGDASPYPSDIAVSGMMGTITDVNITLNEMSHTFPDDFHILLVSPEGSNFYLMGEAGSGGDITGVTITLDDGGAAALSDGSPLVSGTFRPTRHDESGSIAAVPFGAPAPAGPYNEAAPSGSSTFESVFAGEDPERHLEPLVYDRFFVDSGSIDGGWSITITTLDPPTPTPTSTPVTVVLPQANRTGPQVGGGAAGIVSAIITGVENSRQTLGPDPTAVGIAPPSTGTGVITPPSTGDAGLSESGSSSVALIGAIVFVSLVVAAAGRRLVA